MTKFAFRSPVSTTAIAPRRRWPAPLRRVGQGIAGLMMLLPVLARGSVMEGFRAVSELDGITGVDVMGDGAIRLRLENGATLSVPAGDVRIAENGTIFVSDRIVDMAGEVAQTTTGGGGGGSGAVLGLGALGGMGGGGGGAGGSAAPTPEPPLITLSQVAADGGITSDQVPEPLPEGTERVQITLTDANGATLQETVTVTADGSWALPAGAQTLPQGRIGVTLDPMDGNGDPLPQLSTEVHIDTIAPVIAITDLGVGADGVLNTAEAQAGITVQGTTDAQDGQVVTLTLDGVDHTATVAGGTWQVTVPAGALTALAEGAVTLAATVTDAAGNPATPATASMITDFTAPAIAIDPVSGDGRVTLHDLQGDLVLTGTTDAPAGQMVTVRFDGADYSGPVLAGAGANTWAVSVPQAALAALRTSVGDSPGTQALSVTVSDAAGNAATPVAVSFDTDFTSPSISIDPVAEDGVVSAAEAGVGLTVTGQTTNVPEGQTVTVQVSGLTLQTGTAANGNWQVSLTPDQVLALADGTNLTILADVHNDEGIAAPQATAGLATDFTAPVIAITDVGVGADGVLNTAEAQADITVQGTTDAQDGQVVTLTLDGVDHTATVAGGAWQVTVPAGALTALAEGAVTLAATVTDAAGNPATPATASMITDFTAPDITLPSLADGATLDIAARDALTGIAVTTTAPDGSAVTLSFRRPDGTEDVRIDTTVSGGGSFTIPLEAGDVAALQDLTDYTLSVTLADAAGNPASLNQMLSTDFSPVVGIATAGQDGVFDLSDPGGAHITGTSAGVEAGQQVTVSLATTAGGAFHTGTATVGADGGWSLALPQAVLAQVAAGTRIDVSADASNAVGRAAPTATDGADAWQAALYRFDATGPGDGVVTLTASGTDGLAVVGGLAIDTDLSFDPAQAGFVAGSGQAILPGLFLIANEAGAAAGSVSLGGIVADAFALPADLYEFDVALSGSDVARLEFRDAEQGGPAALLHGTSDADVLASGAIDSTLRGGGGDDTLQLGSGAHRVTMETDPGTNGQDTITGFTTGTGALADQISLTGAVDLRGAGTDVQALVQGDVLGTDTGFVIFTTALADTSAATVGAGFASLLATAPSETVYVMAGNGTDAVLARVDIDGNGTASSQIMADFQGIGDLGSLDTSAVILPDPSVLAV